MQTEPIASLIDEAEIKSNKPIRWTMPSCVSPVAYANKVTFFINSRKIKYLSDKATNVSKKLNEINAEIKEDKDESLIDENHQFSEKLETLNKAALAAIVNMKPWLEGEKTNEHAKKLSFQLLEILDLLNQIRWQILEHDATKSKISKGFSAETEDELDKKFEKILKA